MADKTNQKNIGEIMKMKTLTIEKIMEFNPCYTYDDLEEMRLRTNLPKRVKILDFLDSDVPKKDILWTVLRPEIIPKMKLHELKVKFAERALENERKAGREPHPASWLATRVKKQWINNKATDEELSAAKSAAESAAESAWSAAEAAAESAAWAAAEVAEESAAWVAAKSAAWAAARSAEESWQIKQIKKILEGK